VELNFKEKKFADIAEKTSKEIVEVLFGETPESFSTIPGVSRISLMFTKSFDAFGLKFTAVHIVVSNEGLEVALMAPFRMLFFKPQGVFYWFHEGLFAAEIPLQDELLQRARKNIQFDSFLRFFAFQKKELAKRLEEAYFA